MTKLQQSSPAPSFGSSASKFNIFACSAILCPTHADSPSPGINQLECRDEGTQRVKEQVGGTAVQKAILIPPSQQIAEEKGIDSGCSSHQICDTRSCCECPGETCGRATLEQTHISSTPLSGRPEVGRGQQHPGLELMKSARGWGTWSIPHLCRQESRMLANLLMMSL